MSLLDVSTRMTTKELGKIKSISLGFGGYDDCMLGLSVTLEMGGSCVGDFKGWWKKYPEEQVTRNPAVLIRLGCTRLRARKPMTGSNVARRPRSKRSRILFMKG